MNWLHIWRNGRRDRPFKELTENSLLMKRSEVKEGLRNSIGSLLSNPETDEVNTVSDFGNFYCSVEKFEQFYIIKRSFQTHGESLHIPFSSEEPGVQMIFSLDGHSFFNRQFDPFTMGPSTHSINFFNDYTCVNLLDNHSRQHDITFRLRRSFYSGLVAQFLTADDGLSSMIAQQKEFNTINQNIAADAAVHGILKNILECPFEGSMKGVYLREHIRALFMLQLFHFDALFVGSRAKPNEQFTTRDRDTLHAVKEYIDGHFLSPTSLDDLSRHFGLNEFKLKHGFRILFKSSPIRYLQQKRLTFALGLLRETDKTIKEISHEIGYSHPANFTTAFVRTFGNPPQHFRGNRKG